MLVKILVEFKTLSVASYLKARENIHVRQLIYTCKIYLNHICTVGLVVALFLFDPVIRFDSKEEAFLVSDTCW